MILSTQEIEWVKERMNIYVIKYQEIYDEILDHILTAIEERRKAGDDQNIESLFQNVVDDDFSGYIGIEVLAEDEEKLYQKKIRTIFYSNLKQQFNWKTLLIAVVLIAIAFQLPNVR
jgi:Ca2+-binding EF-hand superfamily protein